MPELHYHGGPEKSVRLAVHVEATARVLVLVSCDRFLYRMVRRIVGGLVEVGRGRMAPERIASAARFEVPTAPPEGLSLDAVDYPEGLPSHDLKIDDAPELTV